MHGSAPEASRDAANPHSGTVYHPVLKIPSPGRQWMLFMQFYEFFALQRPLINTSSSEVKVKSDWLNSSVTEHFGLITDKHASDENGRSPVFCYRDSTVLLSD